MVSIDHALAERHPMALLEVASASSRRPVHLANDHALVTVTPDDLVLPRAAAG